MRNTSHVGGPSGAVIPGRFRLTGATPPTAGQLPVYHTKDSPHTQPRWEKESEGQQEIEGQTKDWAGDRAPEHIALFRLSKFLYQINGLSVPWDFFPILCSACVCFFPKHKQLYHFCGCVCFSHSFFLVITCMRLYNFPPSIMFWRSSRMKYVVMLHPLRGSFVFPFCNLEKAGKSIRCDHYGWIFWNFNFFFGGGREAISWECLFVKNHLKIPPWPISLNIQKL